MDITIIGKIGFYLLMAAILLSIVSLIYLLMRLNNMGKELKQLQPSLANINKSLVDINQKTTIINQAVEKAKKSVKSSISSLSLALGFISFYKCSEETGLNRIKDSAIKTVNKQFPKKVGTKAITKKTSLTR